MTFSMFVLQNQLAPTCEYCLKYFCLLMQFLKIIMVFTSGTNNTCRKGLFLLRYWGLSLVCMFCKTLSVLFGGGYFIINSWSHSLNAKCSHQFAKIIKTAGKKEANREEAA